MAHKRIHVRVPITGEATLSDQQGIHIRARTIDISPGGLGVVNPSNPIGQTEYDIEVTTVEGESIRLTATLIRKSEESAGFKTSDIDENNLRIIADLVAKYQTTDCFIKQIDEHDLFDQQFVDDDGNELEVTFDVDQKE